MQNPIRLILSASAIAALSACASAPIGDAINDGVFGEATLNNAQLLSGQKSYAVALGERFAREVPTTVNFAFDKSYLDAEAKAILRKQADWIKQFPEVRFRVFGYTDLVGTERYNKSLGLRRARVVVNYLVSQGVPRNRVQAVISYGETRPLIPVKTAERANRRAVTQVSGFVQSAPLVLNGKYAQVIWRSYVQSAVPTDNIQGTNTTGTTTASGG